RVDEVVREPDGHEADRDQRDAEERVHGREVRATRTGFHREAEHEVRGVEEEEDEEEDELVGAPDPPVAPGDLGPDRTGYQGQGPEDHALVDGDVAFEVGSVTPLPEVQE